jgi:Ca2+/Na+ antiporter
MMNSINNINNKVTKIFNNPNINFFIIMMLIFIISCYTFINTPLKYAISSFVSNPIIILFTLICVILTSYYNINIAILILLLLFIAIYGSTMFNSNSNSKSKNSIEGFTDENDDDSESESESDDEEDSNDNTNSLLNKKINERKHKEDESLKLDEKIASIKDTILGTVNKINDSGNNDYKQSLLENKQIQFMNEQKNNKNNKNKQKNSSNSNKRSSTKEKFQTVEKRSFNPNDEEDTNLLITKEVLTDMNNRIEYNFESNKYLKKYLKHRIEEVVELNKLLDDE